MILSWTALQPSALERRWRAGAIVAAGAICVALATAALSSDPRHPLLLSIAVVGCLTATCVACLWPRALDPRELAIGRDGVVLLRTRAPEPAGEAQALRAIFGAPWLITLRGGSIWVAVWPDSLPPDAFRRLWVSIRWSRAAPPAASGTQVKA